MAISVTAAGAASSTWITCCLLAASACSSGWPRIDDDGANSSTATPFDAGMALDPGDSEVPETSTTSGSTQDAGSDDASDPGSDAGSGSVPGSGRHRGSGSGTASTGGGGTVTSSGDGGSAACSWSGGLSYNGNASFTCYYFGQGQKGPNGYQSACGYAVTETVGGNGGNCGQAATDTVQNIANSGLAKDSYFAAIPGDANGGFSNVVHCGECAEITNPSNGKSVVATIIDECPTGGDQNAPCASAGHLDLSMQAFNALDFGSGDPSGASWKSVPCPVTGNIQAVLNAGVSSQIYFQNTVLPVKSVSGAQLSQWAYWDFGGGGTGHQATLTDVEGHTVTATIPSGGGDMKVQFPSAGSCP
jgi:expansin (peptidoglycan-binding protein)